MKWPVRCGNWLLGVWMDGATRVDHGSWSMAKDGNRLNLRRYNFFFEMGVRD